MNILDPVQQEFLKTASKKEFIAENFYLTGGTALAEFYLKHRYSEDLDFFSEKEINTEEVTVFIKSIQNGLSFKNFEFQQSFNRNIYFLNFEKDQLKLEFTYFPFERIERGAKFGKLEIDSQLDIAVNKLFSIYQNPKARDYIDLYLIIKSEKYDLDKLVGFSRVKFDWHIDYLKLGTQFNLCQEVKDYPRMIKKTDPQEWQNFFTNYAKGLKPKVTT
jgi:predicted nucleotidyltransferase component of viral defense system